LLREKNIYDITPFTHLDYPEHLACIVWFCGCPLRCGYCYNKDIVFSKEGRYTYDDFFIFLSKRQGLLDGVVLSGGEASRVGLEEFCKKIKDMGFKIKLDTSGVFYENIKKLVELNLVDFIALDYKAPKRSFVKVTNSSLEKYNNFEKTLIYLIEQDMDFEVRTTVHRDLLDENDINLIIEDLYNKGYKSVYYLQNFFETENIAGIKSSKTVFDKEKLITDKIKIKYRNF